MQRTLFVASASCGMAYHFSSVEVPCEKRVDKVPRESVYDQWVNVLFVDTSLYIQSNESLWSIEQSSLLYDGLNYVILCSYSIPVC